MENKEMQPSSSTKVTLIGLNDGKAGMKGLDKERINEIIKEASKDSPFYKHVLRKEERINNQVNCMLKKWAAVDESQKQAALKIMEKNRVDYERQAKDLSQIVVHVDMDMFFAAVEIRDNPSLSDKPVAVGSMSMISTSNYVARRFGVRAAMAGFIGKKLCPDLLLIKCDFQKYKKESGRIMEILRKYDPDICVVSCDEAYLNITSFVTQEVLAKPGNSNKKLLIENDWTQEKRLLPEVWEHAAEVVQRMRNEVFETSKLTASAGISTNTMLAKICSDLNKPNGQYMLPGHSFKKVQDFVAKIDVRKIPGIGPVSEKILKAFNIQTCEDIWKNRDMIYLLFDQRTSTTNFYLRVSLGLGNILATREEDEPRKSQGRERSFRPTNNMEWLSEQLKEMAEDVAGSLSDQSFKGRTITLKLKRDSFDSYIKSKTLSAPTSNANFIFQTAKGILRGELESTTAEVKYRLMGVRVSNLVETNPEDNKQPTMDKFLFKTTEEQPSPSKRKITRKVPEKPDSSQPTLKMFLSMDNSEDNQPQCKKRKGAHQDERSDPCDSETSGDAPNEYFCTYCGVSFNNYCFFIEHVSRCPNAPETSGETGEQYMVCPVCNVCKFENLNELNAHLDICLATERHS